MAVVDYDEQQRRDRKAGGALTIFGMAFLLGIPVIGWFGALMAAAWLASKAWIKSSNRLVDVSLAIGGLIPFYLVVWATAGNIANGIFLMWFCVSLYSLAWIWLLHSRAQVASD